MAFFSLISRQLKPTARLYFFLKIVLLLAVANTAYLGWRYLALRAGLVEAGTGICSLTETVDCDKVLSTPEARAFFVPNALLGFGFFFGCLLWLTIGERLGGAYQYHIVRTLAVWLIVATFFTFRFFWLLVQLPAFCPLCPFNHLLTYAATILAVLIWRRTARPAEKVSAKPLIILVTVCVGQFFLWLFVWFLFLRID